MQKICEDPKCNLRERDKNKNSIGQVAAATGNVLILLDLHNLGVDFSSNPGEQKATPILMACENGHLGAVEYLAQRYPETLEVRDSFGRTPVIVATLNGDLPTLIALKTAGADLSVRWENGKRPVDLFEHNNDHKLHAFFVSANKSSGYAR
jgi:ankyrin repeat protein